MTISRPLRYAFAAGSLALALSGVAAAQSSEITSIFEVDPTLALNGFAVFAGAIVLLFESFRSRP